MTANARALRRPLSVFGSGDNEPVHETALQGGGWSQGRCLAAFYYSKFFTVADGPLCDFYW